MTVPTQHVVKKSRWQEVGLSLFLALSVVRGCIDVAHTGDWAGAFGFSLLPLLLWVAYFWQHYWRREPKELTWADTALGVIAWLFTVGLLERQFHT